MTRFQRRGKRTRVVLACVAAAMTAACGTFSSNPSPVDAWGNPTRTLLANKTLNLTRDFSVGVEYIVLGTALYWLVDPLAPNWQLQQAPLGADRVRIALRKKRISSGGDGEAAQVFARLAGQLARDGGFAGYTVMEYTEGVESTLPLAERVAQGVIQLKR